MNREDVLELIKRLTPADEPHMDPRAVGAMDNLNRLAEEIRGLPPGPDDWRTPIGAPAIAGCPVEEMPRKPLTKLRVWHVNQRGEEAESYAWPAVDDPGAIVAWERSETWSRHLQIRDVIAWRPAAVGPGKGAA